MCELHAYQTKPVGISGYCNIPKMVSLNLANAKESTLNHIPSRGFKNSPFRNTYTAVFTIGVHFYCFTRIPFLAVNSKQQPQKLYTAAVLWFLFNGKWYWPLHLDCFNMVLPSVGVDTLQCPGSLFENSGARSHPIPSIWLFLRWPERRLPFAFSQSNFLVPWSHSLPGWLTQWSSCPLQPWPHLTGLVSRSLSCIIPVNFVTSSQIPHNWSLTRT